MDISIGNLVGNNIFNILSEHGAATVVKSILIPGGFVESGLFIDCLFMMLVSFLPWQMMRKAQMVTRRNGILLFSCYA